MTDSDALPSSDALPEAIVSRDQWVCWRTEERDGKPTKVPVDPRTGLYASTTDSRTWTEFEQAREYAAVKADGIGFVFTAEDSLVGVDLDDCRDAATGRPDTVAKDIVGQLDSYTEVSPSGTGYHVLVVGALPGGRNRRGSVEMYDRARFFTVTGAHVEGTPETIEERTTALTAVHREHVAAAATESDSSLSDGDSGSLSDSRLLERARNAKNGEKFDRLWSGSTTGYASQSEADMALCCLLAFWTGGDATRMDRLFRDSGLIREKWDDTHYADGSTYGEVTISRAIDVTTEFYDPEGGHGNESEQESGAPSKRMNEAAYAVEQVRLLEQRLQELEAVVQMKQDRIDTLERKLRRFETRIQKMQSDRDEREGPVIGRNRDGILSRFLG